MSIEIGLTDETTNTQYAPLAAILYRYQQQNMLKALDQIEIQMKMREISGLSKLKQVMISILAGCETLSEVNTKLKSEVYLAQIGSDPRFVDQSSLSRTLDALSQKNIEQLRQANQEIRQQYGQTSQHDWRKYLWLDFDLSGLPCGPQAEESQKGYFSEKKTKLDDS